MDALSDKIKLVKDIPADVVGEMRKKLVPVVDYDRKVGIGYTFKNRENIPVGNMSYTWITDEHKEFPKVKLNGFLFREDATPIISFHSYGYYGFFKPSLREVYSAIYFAFSDDWDKVGYFWLDDMGYELNEMMLGEYHFCKLWLWDVNALSEVVDTYVKPIALSV